MNNYKIVSAVSLVLAIVILLLLEWQVERNGVIDARNVQRQEIASNAQDLRTRIAARISQDVNILYGLRAFIESNPNVTQEDYAKYAASLKRTHPAIRNIAAAPDLIVRYIYPYEENKAVLGLDYRKGPDEQKSGIYKAIRAGKPVVAGPVTLVQGGEALIMRLPVFVDTVSEKKDLWGIISAPVDLDTIYRELKFEEFTSQYELAIRGQDGLGYDGAVFYGDKRLFSENSDSISYEIVFDYGFWAMAVKPKGGWVTSYPGQDMTRIIFFALFIVVTILWLFAVGYIKGRLEARLQKMQILREKTEFLEILSHEIRSPLQGVLASQKYLLDNGIEEPMRSIVKTAQQSCDYIISLIND
ncbi:MAG: CHASE domain-containing protein, partial [Sneathiella sp.]|nr:CHASE domain-containing protein [Sneathiella sp.]